jgi:hypothetical protein
MAGLSGAKRNGLFLTPRFLGSIATIQLPVFDALVLQSFGWRDFEFRSPFSRRQKPAVRHRHCGGANPGVKKRQFALAR